MSTWQVRISRMAYPNRMPHGAFTKRYAMLAPPAWRESRAAALLNARGCAPGDAPACATCTELLKLLVDDAARYQLGKTKVRHAVVVVDTWHAATNVRAGAGVRRAGPPKA